MTVTDADIVQIAGDVWCAVLGLDLAPAGADGGQNTAGRVFTGCVQITGAYQGAVTLDCSAALARRATAIMFERPVADVDDEETRDVIGELANMTGGNVKALLEGTCQLSLPAVTEGTDYRHTVPGGRVVNRVALSCGGEPLTVTLFQQTASAAQ
ncbi:MAG: chemotaxis protein CheX [Euzebyaceae bacterium]|nr:chemotaxis protein CheX [Euzebyaceae bacterium]